jgi:outer membrane protein OmpA-like peptidoglycan-associated protein
MRSKLYTTIFMAGFGLVAASAAYAADPSVDQLIKQLSPTPGVTRGSKPVVTAPGQPSQPAPKAMETTASTSTAAPSASMTLTFQSGSATLTPSAMKSLDKLGTALSSQQLSSYKFLIEGHTDTVGTPDSNMTLSQSRANAAAAYLEQKFNIPAARIQAVGKGEDGLAVQTGPNVSDARNRRVQIINQGPA